MVGFMPNQPSRRVCAKVFGALTIAVLLRAPSQVVGDAGVQFACVGFNNIDSPIVRFG